MKSRPRIIKKKSEKCLIMYFILSEKQFKYVSFAINNDINEMTFNRHKNPVNQGPLRHMYCTLKTRAMYIEHARTMQQFLLDLAALPESVLSTQFFPNVLYISIFLY